MKFYLKLFTKYNKLPSIRYFNSTLKHVIMWVIKEKKLLPLWNDKKLNAVSSNAMLSSFMSGQSLVFTNTWISNWLIVVHEHTQTMLFVRNCILTFKCHSDLYIAEHQIRAWVTFNMVDVRSVRFGWFYACCSCCLCLLLLLLYDSYSLHIQFFGSPKLCANLINIRLSASKVTPEINHNIDL